MIKSKVVAIDTEECALHEIADKIQRGINNILDDMRETHEVIDFDVVEISTSFPKEWGRKVEESGFLVVIKYSERML